MAYTKGLKEILIANGECEPQQLIEDEYYIEKKHNRTDRYF